MEITLSNRQRSVQLDLPWLRSFSEIALEECLKHPAHTRTVLPDLDNVDVVIVSDRVIADVHVRFMNIPGPTDVITFDHGEILISAQTAGINAAKYGKPIDHETALYIIHGLLHLNGYTDKKEEAARKMHKLQNQILDACLKRKDSSS
ncbi:MAG: rRNA maturation RNase YbeY [Chthoniobacteraceae bacterium]